MHATVPGDSDGDETLMLAYGAGDARAFEHLYARHKGPTYRYFLRHTQDRGAAEELHQDLWLRVVRSRAGYRADARFATWLYTLARHRLVDHWRRNGSDRFESVDELDGDSSDAGDAFVANETLDPLRRAMNAETGMRLLDALAGIPSPQRDAFLLHVEAGLTLAEIAALAGAPVETIKTRLRYAYRRLRAALEDLR
jgi:RNA polymerase sigma-70 factor (ECF subfamily)